MRKLKLQIQISIDGFIAGPNGEMDWMTWDWDDALKNYIQGITDPVDCIILGRKLAEGFIPYWADIATKPEHPEHHAGVKFTETGKIVFTKKLNTSEWENTVLAKGDLAEEIAALKSKPGNDIITYGGANFVSALIKQKLIDELHLLVNPTVVGKGMPIFQTVEIIQNMKLVTAIPFDCGIVGLCYKPKSS